MHVKYISATANVEQDKIETEITGIGIANNVLGFEFGWTEKHSQNGGC
jgi:hypothetical protein